MCQLAHLPRFQRVRGVFARQPLVLADMGAFPPRPPRVRYGKQSARYRGVLPVAVSDIANYPRFWAATGGWLAAGWRNQDDGRDAARLLGYLPSTYMSFDPRFDRVSMGCPRAGYRGWLRSTLTNSALGGWRRAGRRARPGRLAGWRASRTRAGRAG